MRKEEEYRLNAQANVDYHNTISGIAQWENKTNKRIANNIVQRRFEMLKTADKDELDAKRERLRSLLAQEEAELQQELLRQKPDPVAIHAEMEARAKALSERREAARQKYADEMRYKQWRAACDPLRSHDSKIITVSATNGRAEQVQAKKDQKEQAQAEEAVFAEMWEKERLKKEERYTNDIMAARQRDAECVTMLDEQLRVFQLRKSEDAREREREEQELKKTWAAADAEAAAAEEAARAHARQLGVDLLNFNIENQKQVEAQLAEERRLDEMMVRDAMNKAKAEEERERDARAQAKEEARMYRKHLMAMMQREAQTEGERDRLIKEYEDQAWAKREKVWQAEANARAKLLEDVLATRKRQVAEHDELKRASHQEMMADRARLVEEKAQMDRRAREDAERSYRLKVQNRADIEAQMQAREEKKQQAAMEAKREYRQAMLAEQAYQSAIAEDIKKTYERASAAEHRPSYGRKTSNWFS